MPEFIVNDLTGLKPKGYVASSGSQLNIDALVEDNKKYT